MYHFTNNKKNKIYKKINNKFIFFNDLNGYIIFTQKIVVQK